MNIVLCAAAGYFILSSAVRLLGRRTASMIAPFDLVLLPLFGGITSGAVVGEDHSMAGVTSHQCSRSALCKSSFPGQKLTSSWSAGL